MHDLDRTLRAYDSEADTDREAGDYESDTEYDELNQEYDQESDQEYGAISEHEENELAEELLTLSTEAELDQFLGKYFRKAAGRFTRTFAPLGKMLKPLAKKLLPIAGAAVGTYFGGPAGGALGGKLGSLATNLFELGSDFEFLPPQEQQLEVARRFLRFASTAAQEVAAAEDASPQDTEPSDDPAGEPAPDGDGEPQSDPVSIAQAAVAAAADIHAPALAQRLSQLRPRKAASRRTSGRWYRKGNAIVVRGA
jgi:hypothetical protein